MPGEPLSVLLNASAVPKRPAGAGVYTLEFARALTARDDVHLIAASPWANMPCDERLPSPRRNAAERTAWEFGRLPRLAATTSAAVYHGAHMTVPIGMGLPTVSTVHDVTFMTIGRRYSLARRSYYRGLAESARRATCIIVPSGAVAGDVVEHLQYDRERIRVVHEAPRPWLRPVPREKALSEVEKRFGIAGDYVVMVGTLEPGKRAVDAVRAMACLTSGPGERLQLVLAGSGPLRAALEREARRLGVEGRVVFPGYVANRDLSVLLSGAVALLFLSLYEGFGLPPVEAMACGTPVVCSDTPAMDEIYDGGADFVPLRDPEAVARAVERLLDPGARADAAGRASEFAARFSWAKAAEETVAVYRELVR